MSDDCHLCPAGQCERDCPHALDLPGIDEEELGLAHEPFEEDED